MLRESNGLWGVGYVIQIVIQNMNKKKKIEYPAFCQRMSQSNKNWLNKERKNFDSWNQLFSELRKIYVKRKR